MFRHLVLTGGLVAALASAASAQSPSQSPTFVRAPSGPDMVKVYPARALAEGVEGQATLTCVAAPEGRLQACTIAAETPAGYGFGEAALRLTPRFQLDPARTPAGNTVQFTLRFQAW